jgi:chemotaxis protein methyltransferase CheR
MNVTSEDIARLRSIVSQRLGLVFDDSHLNHLVEVLRQRVRSTASPNSATYFSRLTAAGFGNSELSQLANELTVGETYFFRHPDHFRAFTEVALPQRLRERNNHRPVSILSAGCASGEEPYTLAILACETLGHIPAEEVRITGIDVSPAMLDRAARARYSGWSLRATPTDRRQQYFQNDGREYILDGRIRSMVAFERCNLLDDDPRFWRPEAFDIIFFRNVAIYFSPDTLKTVIARLARSLVPGGFLFLGPSENLRNISNEFHLLHTHETFYYQRRRSEELKPVSARASTTIAEPVAVESPPYVELEQDQSWMEEIHRAAQRISALAGNRPDGSRKSTTTSGISSPTTPPPIEPAGDLDLARELMRQERFDDAMAALRELPAASAADVDALLLHAVISTNKGRAEEAESICRRILVMDELNAGAHYLLALCREHVGDLPAAAEHDQAAVYLDPAFAAPHVHLGMMTKRKGDLTTAQRELQKALELLEREDAARILLFGGGFSRDALMQLCRAELRACGGVR